MDKRVCKKCNTSNGPFRVRRIKKGDKYYNNTSTICSQCKPRYRNRSDYDRNDPVLALQSRIRIRNKKFGVKVFYSMEELRELVSLPCHYCHRLAVSGLDRKDSARGYEKDNIIPCCRRCNTFKNDIPYEAWLLIVPGLVKAQELGLLDHWRSERWKKKI